MRKRFSLTIALLCLISVSAQTSFYATDIYPDGYDNPIVRSLDNGKAAITYYEVGNFRYQKYWFLKDELASGPYPNQYCPVRNEIECLSIENMQSELNTYADFNFDNSNIIIDTSSVVQRTLSVICNNH